MNIWSILDHALCVHFREMAVVDGAIRFNYAEIGRRICSLAAFLLGQGVSPGERISILDHNSLEYLETYFAAAGLGAVLNPLNHRLSHIELTEIINDAKPSWLLARADYAHLLQEILPGNSSLKGVIWIGGTTPDTLGVQQESYQEIMQGGPDNFSPRAVKPDDAAHLYYTSGTTGKPKGVLLTHKNVCMGALATIAEFNLTSDDVWAHIAPMFHLADAWAVFSLTCVGGRHVMIPNFDIPKIFSIMQSEAITLTNLIPATLNMMLNHPSMACHDYRSLRLITTGGAPISRELIKQTMESFGCDYFQTYGMTENSPCLTSSSLPGHLAKLPFEQKLEYLAKTGRPFMNVQLKVVDHNGDLVARDETQVGEIWVKGDTITPGYWRCEPDTRLAFDKGWFKTGDLAVMDADNFVTIVDRKKDMIISGGENIYSIEVEKVLNRHPEIMECAVFAVPDPVWGEAVMAAVVTREGSRVSQVELIEFCKRYLASYKTPKSIIFRTELPKTGSGKIAKKTLRGPYWVDKSRKIG